MASCKLRIKPSAVKEIEELPKTDRHRIIERIRRLAEDPRPPGSEKLSGQEQYRLRQGNYRILYTIEIADLIIVLVKVGHRRDAYR